MVGRSLHVGQQLKDYDFGVGALVLGCAEGVVGLVCLTTRSMCLAMRSV